MQWVKKISLADLATLGNGMCGFFAIVYAHDRNFLASCLFILLGAMLDGLDGYLARKFPSKHNSGHILDSISDTISFCIAPAMLIYAQFYSLRLGSAFTNMRNFLTILALSLVALLGLIRLIKYSIQGYKYPVFRGLPTPAAAMSVVALSLMYGPKGVFGEHFAFVLLPVCVIAPLMITDIKYPKAREGVYRKLSIFSGVFLFFTLVGIKFNMVHLARVCAPLAFITLAIYIFSSPLIYHYQQSREER